MPDFLQIAFEEFQEAWKENKHLDSDYVKKRACDRYDAELMRQRNYLQANEESSFKDNLNVI